VLYNIARIWLPKISYNHTCNNNQEQISEGKEYLTDLQYEEEETSTDDNAYLLYNKADNYYSD
jgi:hypothetical protein